MDSPLKQTLVETIRSIPDYPKPGVMFRDITTLLGNARAFRRAVDELVHPYAGGKVDQVAGIEARGFIVGGAMAHQLSSGFVPIRKKGKLPHDTVRIAYSLEYGVDEMEMHRDAIVPGDKVILVDDLIATGGTAEAAVKLLQQMGADIVSACASGECCRSGFLSPILPSVAAERRIQQPLRLHAHPVRRAGRTGLRRMGA